MGMGTLALLAVLGAAHCVVKGVEDRGGALIGGGRTHVEVHLVLRFAHLMGCSLLVLQTLGLKHKTCFNSGVTRHAVWIIRSYCCLPCRLQGPAGQPPAQGLLDSTLVWLVWPPMPSSKLYV